MSAWFYRQASASNTCGREYRIQILGYAGYDDSANEAFLLEKREFWFGSPYFHRHRAISSVTLVRGSSSGVVELGSHHAAQGRIEHRGNTTIGRYAMRYAGYEYNHNKRQEQWYQMCTPSRYLSACPPLNPLTQSIMLLAQSHKDRSIHSSDNSTYLNSS